MNHHLILRTFSILNKFRSVLHHRVYVTYLTNYEIKQLDRKHQCINNSSFAV
jgi:hypothetical protein